MNDQTNPRELIAQANQTIGEIIGAERKVQHLIEELRPKLVDALDHYVMEQESAIALSHIPSVALKQSTFGEEPSTLITYADFSHVRFNDETGQTEFAIDGETDEEGTPENIEKGIECLRQSAEYGCSEAIIYMSGIGVEDSPYWEKKAKEEGLK